MSNGMTDPPQPTSYDDDYPADWNRIYKGGDLIKAFPPMVDGLACALVNCIYTIEQCDRAIADYAAAGISGTAHDIEHREMRAAALKYLKECLP